MLSENDTGGATDRAFTTGERPASEMTRDSDMRPWRVCLVTSEYPPLTAGGGVGRYMFHLADGLAAEGHHVTVICANTTRRIHRSLEGRVKVVRIPHPSYRGLPGMATRLLSPMSKVLSRYSRSVVDVIGEIAGEEGDFDVIEASLWNGEASAWTPSARTALITRLVTPVFKVRELAGEPNDLGLEQLEASQCAASTRLAAISQAIGDLIVERYGISRDKLELAPLGLPDRPRSDAPRAHQPRILYVGRLEPRKGTEYFLEAIPALLRRFSGLRVDIVGQDTRQSPSGSYVNHFKRVVPESLQDRVRFHGYLPDSELYRLYDEAWVFVAPSLYESFGLVFLEAMASGVPVVGTDVGGIPDIVDSQVGRLVPIRSAGAIVDACSDLLSDRDALARLGAAARHRYTTRFSAEAMVRQTVALYSKAREGDF